MSLPKREVGQTWIWTDGDTHERHVIIKIDEGVTSLECLEDGYTNTPFEYSDWKIEAQYWSLEIESDLIDEIPDKETIEI